ncbi:hypothetical protein [Ruminococcus sp.]|uniref:hypothetical protein n=1 Tax=Ruminococcus sp. TaxID=41978 RepID=UPI002E81067D|nr:hypothetical protein [Ruminococcus sp.]MEE3491405.1 hypothetical protein [Ruminococcus sp.]
MKYCKTCKQLCFGETLPFDGCKHKLREIEDINEPVRLCVAGGTERAMLTGMLKDANIPYMEEPVYPQGVANEIVTGYDVKLSNISIVVPFSALPKAVELLGTIETLPHDLEPHMDEITARIERLKADIEEAKSMSPAMRTTVKVLSALAFLALIALAVFGVDAITGWIKSLF